MVAVVAIEFCLESNVLAEDSGIPISSYVDATVS
jgi:hypothetical protein